MSETLSVRGVEQIPWLYDAGMAVLEAAGLGAWRRELVGGIRGRRLDLGCGTGRNLPLFAGPARTMGLDPCFDALQTAKGRGHDSPLVLGRAEALPFRGGAFDTVVSGLVFCSVTSPTKALAEVRRVLAEGGALRMLEHVRLTGRFSARLQDLTQPAWTWFTGGCHPNRQTERSVESAGFRIDPQSRKARGSMRLFSAR